MFLENVTILPYKTPKNQKNAFFDPLELFQLTDHDSVMTLPESYNQFLKRKWIYMEVHMGRNAAPPVIWKISLSK